MTKEIVLNEEELKALKYVIQTIEDTVNNDGFWIDNEDLRKAFDSFENKLYETQENTLTKKEKIKLNKLFNDSVVEIALDHSDFSALAADHWKQYLYENYESPAKWAEENLSPDEIKDILKGKDIVGADFKKEERK